VIQPPQLLAEHPRPADRLHHHLTKLNAALDEHARAVADLAAAVAEQLGLVDDERQTVQVAALLHDLGKVAVDERLLRKPGPLSADEWSAVRCHPEVGERLAREALALPEKTVVAIRHHHERFDGQGYPDGLAGHEIPLAARIVAVADAYDAMTSDRPYRRALTPLQAKTELARCAGTHFCPDVVAAFLSATSSSAAA
jgi:putative nucleotidyltransferase with HDIG domain